MAVQILAVRMDASKGENIQAITEIVWRQDETGTCSGLSRHVLGEWMASNPAEIVYVRDYSGVVTRVQYVRTAAETYIASMTQSPVDPLLTLPRYVTETP